MVAWQRHLVIMVLAPIQNRQPGSVLSRPAPMARPEARAPATGARRGHTRRAPDRLTY
jgi:hypothetical protein